jgi:hypothetical protein
MKTLIIILFPLMTYCQSNLLAKIPQDKALHFTTGFMISATTGVLLNEAGVKHPHLYGLGAGIAAGIIKELIDSKADPNDAYATAGGAIMGTIVIFLPTRKRYARSKSN